MVLKTAAPAPPAGLDDGDNGEDFPGDIEVTFEGYAARRVAEGARLTRTSRGDFVIESAMSGVAMAEWEAAGYQIVARDARGREFDLTPAIYGIRPPHALFGSDPRS